MAASEKGYENGLGAMSAEARMAASEKGYKNGIVVMAACEKGSSNNKMGMWERKFDEFKRCMGMPERGTLLHAWQHNQLSNGSKGLNAKIQKEIEENEESTVWSERRVKLSDCVEQMNRAKISIAWERKFDGFKRCVEMPEKGTPLYAWQENQLSICLNAKIRKEIEENEGSAVWSEWRVKLSDCVGQKNRAKIGITWERKFNEFKRCAGTPKKGNKYH